MNRCLGRLVIIRRGKTMTNSDTVRHSSRIVTALAAWVALGLGFIAAPSAKAQNLTTLYSFCSQAGCTDGANPYTAGVVQGTDGNLYGVTYQGGNANSAGTVFKLTPNGTLTTLYSFCNGYNCPDGWNPVGLIQGADGYFYGTTSAGGEVNNHGTP